MSSSATTRIRKRLQPLYWAAFFTGFVLWYTVELLLAQVVGLSPAAIGAVLAAMSGLIIICEIPAGIVADRWSRKGVLLIGAGFMVSATVTGALATTSWHFVLHYLLWGVFYALYSGAYEAMVYDALIEEQGHARDYEFWFGKVGRCDSVALVSSSLLGGLVAAIFGIAAAFWITVPFTLLATFSIWRFHEPQIHKAEMNALYSHLGQTFRSVVSSPLMRMYLVITVLLGATIRTYFEFDQLWLIELDFPVVLFGVVNASILATIGVRSVVVDRLTIQRERLLVGSLFGGSLVSIGLTVPNRFVAAISIVAAALCVMVATLVLSVLQQQHIRSQVRSGANSVLSTVMHASFIPMSLVFGYLASKYGVVNAAWLPVGLLAVSGIVALVAMRIPTNTVK
jgi:MFS family permease